MLPVKPMRGALAVFGLLCGAGCVRVPEATVRERAAADFSCAHYELTVVEVGPEVYRASGCGQELIYACRSIPPNARSEEPLVVCARTPE